MALSENRVSNTLQRVTDGTEGLAYVRAEVPFQDRQRPDLILLDLNLPKLDGHELLGQLKADEDLRAIPVVILTTSQAEIDKDRAYHNHANSYLTKPVDADAFQEMIQDLKLYWGIWNQRPA